MTTSSAAPVASPRSAVNFRESGNLTPARYLSFERDLIIAAMPDASRAQSVVGLPDRLN
jgi:hypothetical protein